MVLLFLEHFFKFGDVVEWFIFEILKEAKLPSFFATRFSARG